MEDDEPPGCLLSQIFGKAGYLDESAAFEEANPEEVIEGDIFIVKSAESLDDILPSIQLAIENGAVALILPKQVEGLPELDELMDKVMIMHVEEAEMADMAQRLEDAFFGDIAEFCSKEALSNKEAEMADMAQRLEDALYGGITEYDSKEALSNEETGMEDDEFEEGEMDEGDEGGDGEPEQTGFLISNIFRIAEYPEESASFEEVLPELVVTGVQTKPEQVLVGDIFMVESAKNLDDILPSAQLAAQNGAVYLILPKQAKNLPGMAEFRDEAHVLFDSEQRVAEMARRLAVAFEKGDEDGDEDGMEGDGKYPEPEQRAYFISDLFGKAAYMEQAVRLEEVIDGDIFILESAKYLDDIVPSVHLAVQSGAVALILPKEAMGLPGLDVFMDQIPMLYEEKVAEMAQRLAVAFYDAPSRDVLVIALVGSKGKTTTSWLVRGVLEELEQTTGMIGSIEYSIQEDRLTVDGDIWDPVEDDDHKAMMAQESSAPFSITPYTGRYNWVNWVAAPFSIAPYVGRYNVETTNPTGLHVQKLMAGMRDRGARCVIVECTTKPWQPATPF
eukprot:gene10597-12263_t